MWFKRTEDPIQYKRVSPEQRKNSSYFEAAKKTGRRSDASPAANPLATGGKRACVSLNIDATLINYYQGWAAVTCNMQFCRREDCKTRAGNRRCNRVVFLSKRRSKWEGEIFPFYFSFASLTRAQIRTHENLSICMCVPSLLFCSWRGDGILF